METHLIAFSKLYFHAFGGSRNSNQLVPFGADLTCSTVISSVTVFVVITLNTTLFVLNHIIRLIVFKVIVSRALSANISNSGFCTRSICDSCASSDFSWICSVSCRIESRFALNTEMDVGLITWIDC